MFFLLKLKKKILVLLKPHKYLCTKYCHIPFRLVKKTFIRICTGSISIRLYDYCLLGWKRQQG